MVKSGYDGLNIVISTVRFSVVINGSPAGFFSAQRGLRQGDPLLPFLFLIAMEGLNSMIKTTSMNGWLRRVDVTRIGERNPEITHLQYVDDTLILFDADEDQLRTLRVILVLFKEIFGLHISWRKSFLYPINEVQNMEILNAILGGESGIYSPSIWGCHWEQNHNQLKYGFVYWKV